VGKAIADPNVPTSSLPEKGKPSKKVLTAPSTDASVAASTVATITANLGGSQGLPQVPPNFVGFSDETQDVIADTIFTPDNTSLINLLTYWIGPSGLWRIGGLASDTNPPPALNQQIANDAQGFISIIGWYYSSVISWPTVYGLDSAVNNANTAVTHASYFLNAFSSADIAFQVGNEPDDLFPNQQSWGSVFNSYYSALNNANSNVNFGAPDVLYLDDIPWVNATIPGASGVRYVTGHKYTLGCTPQSLTPAQVLADATVSGNPGVAISEFGIICGGGQQGITDVLLAATYYLKLAQSALTAGFTAILPHNVLTPFHWADGTVRVSYYNQFVQQPDGGYAPTPMFYGMLLFQPLEGQQVISTTTTNLDSLASVTATIGGNGNANILVVNGDTAHGITVKPQQTSSSPWSQADVYVLSGASCTDPNPVLNGFAIGEGGTWAGASRRILKGQNVAIPACGAALIQILP
jgi:hypothetical protein